VAIIRLGLRFPTSSSSLPGNYDGPPLAHFHQGFALSGWPFGAPRFPIWPCSTWGLPSRSVTGPLVRSYRTFSPLPLIAAVCFLWHFPSLTGPRTTRHAALWSSDFPRRIRRDRPSACQSY